MTQKSLIFSILQIMPNSTNAELSHMLNLPQPSIRRCKAELKNEGFQWD